MPASLRIDDDLYRRSNANAASVLSLPICRVAVKLNDMSIEDINTAEALLNAEEAARLTSAEQSDVASGKPCAALIRLFQAQTTPRSGASPQA